jgi:glycosyltransferase involved in cell wall biosynthesis
MTNPDVIKNPIRVSVIIPAYNVEKYFPKCLESLYQQTLRPEEFEIIIVDDNSTDKTLKIAEEFRDKRVNTAILQNKNNIGPGLSRNKAIKASKGEYVYFLDADDYIDPTTLEQLLMFGYDQDADIVTAGFYRITEDGEILLRRNDKPETIKNRISWVRNALSLSIPPMACNRLIRRKLFIDNEIFFPDSLHEDVFVIYKLFLLAENVVNKSSFFYYWVKRKKSRTNHITRKHINSYLSAMDSHRDFVINRSGGGFWAKVSPGSDVGYYRAAKILLSRILEYEVDKFEYLEYLFLRIKESSRGVEKILNYGKKHEDIVRFIEILNNEVNINLAIQMFLDYLDEKNETDEKNNHKSKKFLHPFLKLISLLKSIIKRKGGFFSKIEYFNYRIYKYLNKRRRGQRLKILKKRKKELLSQINLLDVVFFCDANYHLRNALPIVKSLRKRGVSAGILDYSHYFAGGKRKLSEEEFERYRELVPIIVFDPIIKDELSSMSFKLGIFFNDWGIEHNDLIRELLVKGVKTLGINEGVNDFLKLNEGFTRKITPYRTCKFVSLPGEFDTRFFNDRPGQYFVSGLPQLTSLYRETSLFPKEPLAIINVNFSYGVLTHCRDEFIETAIEGCKRANVDYIITQHPMDLADLSDYKVTDKNMYDTIREGSIFISRFSGAIIESLAMGKPCVYHNPHNEQVVKFQEPLGAYSISDSAESLAEAIKYELERSSKTPVREYSRKFMELHANIHSEKEPEELITETIMKLIKT